jgi:hypothetical protein
LILALCANLLCVLLQISTGWILSTFKDVTLQKYKGNDAKMLQVQGYVDQMADEDFDFVSELPDPDDDPGAWAKDGPLGFLNGVVSTAIKSKVRCCSAQSCVVASHKPVVGMPP